MEPKSTQMETRRKKHDCTEFEKQLRKYGDHRDVHLVLNMLKANHIENLRKTQEVRV
jgi:hypothetical protein